MKSSGTAVVAAEIRSASDKTLDDLRKKQKHSITSSPEVLAQSKYRFFDTVLGLNSAGKNTPKLRKKRRPSRMRDAKSENNEYFFGLHIFADTYKIVHRTRLRSPHALQSPALKHIFGNVGVVFQIHEPVRL